jgi:hypothetical protein
MKIAFCKYAGLANGGVEKYLQTIAILLKSKGHDVDYYYTPAARLTHANWNHPENDINRIKLLESHNINLIHIELEYRHYNSWIGDDFFEKFDESKYDYLVTAGNGESEYPYNKLKNVKIIHTVHGEHPFNQHNIFKSVLLCNWQANRWISNGGDSSKVKIIPSIVYTPDNYTKDFRKKYNIPSDAFVYGFHQRNDNNISSTISLEAYSKIQDDNTYFALLGGAEVHKNYVSNYNLKNVIFADHTSNVNDINDFLDGIDVYAHCRVDGEVCSASIIEAMYHNKPLISYPGINMGHVEQLEDCGKMTYSVDEYKDEMIKLKNKDYYNVMSEKVKQKYMKYYDYKIVEQKMIELFV